MMKNPRPEEEKKKFHDKRNLFILKKELNHTTKKNKEEYCNNVRPCFKYIINILKKSGTWKIQLTIASNFISSIENDEEHVMHSKSDAFKHSNHD